MTWEEALQQILKKYDWKKWQLFSGNDASTANTILKEAAELFRDTYAKSKWEEACEAQRKICVSKFEDNMFSDLGIQIHRILNAPTPEFKP